MKRISLVLMVSFFLIGCATTMPDRVTKLEPFDPKEKQIVISPFEINSGIVSEVNEKFALELGNEIARDLRGVFFDRGYKNTTIDGSSNVGDYLVKGQITEVSGGNKHLRILVGFGCGGTVVTARGEIVDLNKNKTIFDFNITKRSYWTSSDNEAVVRENIHEIAEEIVTRALEKK